MCILDASSLCMPRGHLALGKSSAFERGCIVASRSKFAQSHRYRSLYAVSCGLLAGERVCTYRICAPVRPCVIPHSEI